MYVGYMAIGDGLAAFQSFTKTLLCDWGYGVYNSQVVHAQTPVSLAIFCRSAVGLYN